MTPDAARKLWTDLQNDLTYRFPLIVETVARLRSRSCIIDAEAVACDDNGMTNFDRVRYRRNDARVFLYAFDLIELNGDDLRRDWLEVRKATLANIVARAGHGVGSLTTSRKTARPYSGTPASWGLKASCRSAGTSPCLSVDTRKYATNLPWCGDMAVSRRATWGATGYLHGRCATAAGRHQCFTAD
jgi:ATP dependent DNA ligase domain